VSVTLEELASWMVAEEAEHLEFKAAKNDFDALKLVKYCAALANEGADCWSSA
jgi:ATP-dependent DNA helicase RecG